MIFNFAVGAALQAVSVRLVLLNTLSVKRVDKTEKKQGQKEKKIPV